MTTPSYLEQKLGFRIEQHGGNWWRIEDKGATLKIAGWAEIALWNLLVEEVEGKK